MSESEAEFARELVRRIRANERDAEIELVRTYERGLRTILKHQQYLTEWDGTELMQDTWETALEKIRRGELREPSALRAFVYGIGRGKARNRQRTIIGHPTVSDPADIDALLSESESPEDALIRAQNQELVWKVLQAMRPRDREVLIHFMLREDKNAVCARFNISPARLHGILCRCRQRFHKLLSKTAAGKEMDDDD